MRRISSPPRGCRPRYFPLSVGRRAGSYFRLETIFHFHSSLSLSLFPLTFDLFSPHPSKDFVSPFRFLLFLLFVENRCPQGEPLFVPGLPIGDRINIEEEGRRGNVVPSLMLFFIFALRQTLISGFLEGKTAWFIDVLGERNALRNAPFHPTLLYEGTRVTPASLVSLLSSFFLFFFSSSSFLVKSIRCRGYLLIFRGNIEGTFSSDLKRRNVLLLKFSFRILKICSIVGLQ